MDNATRKYMAHKSYKLGIGDIVTWAANQMRQMQYNKRRSYEDKIDLELSSLRAYLVEIEQYWINAYDAVQDAFNILSEVTGDYYRIVQTLAPTIYAQEQKVLDDLYKKIVNSGKLILPKNIDTVNTTYEVVLQYLRTLRDEVESTIDVRIADMLPEGKSLTTKTKYYIGEI